MKSPNYVAKDAKLPPWQDPENWPLVQLPGINGLSPPVLNPDNSINWDYAGACQQYVVDGNHPFTPGEPQPYQTAIWPWQHQNQANGWDVNDKVPAGWKVLNGFWVAPSDVPVALLAHHVDEAWAALKAALQS